jgi:hypothetical protein
MFSHLSQMLVMDLLFDGKSFHFPSLVFRQTCDTFQIKPLSPQYRVLSKVSLFSNHFY